jgi:hypothetical protein
MEIGVSVVWEVWGEALWRSPSTFAQSIPLGLQEFLGHEGLYIVQAGWIARMDKEREGLKMKI